MALERKLQKFNGRDWADIRGSWLANIPRFPGLGAKPDPGIDQLQPLLTILYSATEYGRFPDVNGIRSSTVWEAVFLFHKCAHTTFAAQRLARMGMHSWCMFNAYHAAYIGAKGIMTLLGVLLVELGGTGRFAIDLYPEPEKINAKIRALGSARFNEFLVIAFPSTFQQRDLWETFQRVMRITKVTCWDKSLNKEFRDIAHDKITPPRNSFLYRSNYWPLDDLTVDADPATLTNLIGEELETSDPGFLMRLSFSVYRLFEQLITDLAKDSGPIRQQVEASRFIGDSTIPELECYLTFVEQVAAQAGAGRV